MLNSSPSIIAYSIPLGFGFCFGVVVGWACDSAPRKAEGGAGSWDQAAQAGSPVSQQKGGAAGQGEQGGDASVGINPHAAP